MQYECITRPRADIVNLEIATHYHVMTRCVRRAFLCGDDIVSGRNFDHRKQWIINQLALLSHHFAIDVLAYAVMSNHYHLVLRICPERAQSMSDHEVVVHWLACYSGSAMLQDYLEDRLPAETRNELETSTIPMLRARLSTLSWFMSRLNQIIALEANQEDEVTGHFFQARFKSQALVDEAAVIACMAYVDLNPIRAKVATTLETSEYTSVKQRIDALHPDTREPPKHETTNIASKKSAIKLVDLDHDDHPNALPMRTEQYLELLDWTGRVQRHDKRGYIQQSTPSILSTLNLSPQTFREKRPKLASSDSYWIAQPKRLQEIALARAQRFVKGCAKITSIS